MQRKRGELVPIGEAIGNLSPAKAIREATPQARHHFTLSDQVNQLAEARETDPDLGFMARLLALCSLPRTNPGNRLQYVRQNGPYSLVMIAGGRNKLPFGNLPRLLLAWVCTEAVRTQNRELILGPSLSEFMRKLDIHTQSGGRGGVRTRLRNQMDRLFCAYVQLIYEDEHGKQFASAPIADRGEFWWDPKRPDEPMLWDSKIRLGEDFFNEIIRHPVPLDMNTLKALKRCRPGNRSLLVAHLPHLLTEAPAAAHLASDLSPVRPASLQGGRSLHRSKLSTQGSTRVEEDQAGLAGSELLDGSWRLDPVALEARRPSGTAASAREIALKTPVPPQGSPLPARAGGLPICTPPPKVAPGAC